jgi:hypothetical protein
MRDVLIRYGLPDCGRYGETLQCRLCNVLVSMQTVTMYHVCVPLLVLFMRSLGLDRLGRWSTSDSRHGFLGGGVKWLTAAFDNEVSNVARLW